MRFLSYPDNLLINPDFLIAQEGTSFTAMADDTYILDGFAYYKSGAMVHTGSQASDAPTVAQSSHKSTTCLLVDCTTADASIAAGDYAFVCQLIEGYRARPLFEREFTIRFWHKHTKTGVYCVAVKNSGSDRTFVREYSQAVSDTWERSVIKIPASPSAGTWDYSSGIGFQIIWTIDAGSTFQTTADAWQTGDYLATSNQVNGSDNVANNFRIAQAAVYPGSFDNKFIVPPYDDQLQACKRYYEQSWAAGTAITPGSLSNTVLVLMESSSRPVNSCTPFQVAKRAAPTMTSYNTQAGTVNSITEYTPAFSFVKNYTGTLTEINENGFRFDGNSNATVGNLATFNWSADARLRI